MLGQADVGQLSQYLVQIGQQKRNVRPIMQEAENGQLECLCLALSQVLRRLRVLS